MLVGAGLLFAGCFSPEEFEGDGPTDTDGMESTGSMTTLASGPTDPSTGSTGPTSGTTSSTTTTTDPDTGSSSESSSETTEPVENGPRLIDSVPAAGDLDAGLDPVFFLYFDRPISQAEALGNIFVSQDGGEPVIVSPQPCPPDADPTCIAGLFPESFYDEDGRLPANTPHEVIVSADLPDLDGITNINDQIVDFTTFDFTANFFDDSEAIDTELGGLDFDAGSQALYVAGVPGNSDCIVRRIPIAGGVPSPASTVATPQFTGGGPYCYGLDIYGGTMLLSMSYSGDVRAYPNLELDNLNASEILIDSPTLPDPHDTLSEVQSVAVSGNRRFFSYGNFVGGPDGFAILEQAADGGWSIFESGENLWDPSDSLNIVAGSVEGPEYLFAHAGDSIFKFRVSDGSLVDELELEQSQNNALLRLDGFDRLYVGRNGSFRVLSAVDFELLEERSGLDTGRFAVLAMADQALVYFARYRDAAVIGRMTINFD